MLSSSKKQSQKTVGVKLKKDKSFSIENFKYIYKIKAEF